MGSALTGPLLSPGEAAQIAAMYPDSRFPSTVNMGRHRFGEGEYRYFAKTVPRCGGRPAGRPPVIACWHPGLAARRRSARSALHAP
jgi:hypothetical protein